MRIYPITIPGGSDGYIQYNNGGIFGGAAYLTYDDVNGQVTVGKTSATYPFAIKSTDATDQIQLYHDNTTPYLRWNDGNLILKSSEGAAHDTVVQIKGLGNSNPGYYQVFDEDDQNLITVKCTFDYGYINVEGGAPSGIIFQSGADVPVMCFQGAAEGETPEFKIYGYRTGDAKRSLEIGTGVDAADTVSFDGLSEYRFDGTVRANTAFNCNGSAGLSGTLTLDDGANWRITLTFTGGILTGQTTAASSAATATWA